jgi:hypothetical protein
MKCILLAAFLIASVVVPNRTTSLDVELGILHGTVMTLNHPEGGMIRGNGEQLNFQNLNYPELATGIRADENGNYVIFLPKGRYRLFDRSDTTSDSSGVEDWDWLAHTQRRIVDIEPNRNIEFNVDTIFPDNSHRNQKKMRTLDNRLSSQMGVILGSVRLITKSISQPVNAGGAEILFQRIDHPQLVFGVRTSKEGIFTVVLTRGRYRVFVRPMTVTNLIMSLREWPSPDPEKVIDIEPLKLHPLDLAVGVGPNAVNLTRKSDLSHS